MHGSTAFNGATREVNRSVIDVNIRQLEPLGVSGLQGSFG